MQTELSLLAYVYPEVVKRGPAPNQATLHIEFALENPVELLLVSDPGLPQEYRGEDAVTLHHLPALNVFLWETSKGLCYNLSCLWLEPGVVCDLLAQLQQIKDARSEGFLLEWVGVLRDLLCRYDIFMVDVSTMAPLVIEHYVPFVGSQQDLQRQLLAFNKQSQVSPCGSCKAVHPAAEQVAHECGATLCRECLTELVFASVQARTMLRCPCCEKEIQAATLADVLDTDLLNTYTSFLSQLYLSSEGIAVCQVCSSVLPRSSFGEDQPALCSECSNVFTNSLICIMSEPGTPLLPLDRRSKQFL